VNKDLFDEAGLPYPPQEYGAPYVDENGEEQPWTMDTLRELGMKLTVDANGNDATSADFDAENIVQFGYMDQFTDLRGVLTMWGAGSLVGDDGKTAQVPDNWREGAKWVYDAMWTDHFYPTDAYVNSDVLRQGNPFQSGNLAMAHVHTWFAAAWALGPDVIDFTWDTAAVPEVNGQVTAKMHADTFCIPKGAKNPEAAFTVLTYLLSEDVAPKLLEIYGGMPARLALQEDYLATYSEKVFPGQEINWQVALDSIEFADNPNHESWMPSFQETSEAYTETWTKLAQEPGLDVDAELDALVEKLQTIFDAAEE
jgi:multiple sugar transport system substrate-binding protein